MLRSLKSILFVFFAVMVFTAQTNRHDDKGRQRVPENRTAPAASMAVPAAKTAPAARTAPAVRKTFGASIAVSRIKIPARTGSFQQRPQGSQFPRQERQAPRVYAVFQPPVPAANNQLFNRQHHNHWQPLYDFYNGQYNFYPYVNIASTVELSTNCVSISFNGQVYSYDRGTFYLQDGQGQYVAVAPPLGIIVNQLPAHARVAGEVDGQTYYRYKGIFYILTGQGYQVVAPAQGLPESS